MSGAGNGVTGRHAVVLGGGLAGLLAAHVLAAHAEKVTLVERDRFPDGPESRPGLPQDRHTHVLLLGGQHAVEKLLPGLVGELVAEGAPRIGAPRDIVHWQAGTYYRRTEPTTHYLTGSRPLTDWVVRRRVLAHPRITTVEGAEAVGLLGDARRVRGVRLRERGSSGRGTHDLAADLVLDTTGRSSRAPRWLAALGAEPPHEEHLETGLAYATRFFKARPADQDLTYRGVYVVPNPAQRRAGIMLPLEGDRWSVILSGVRGDEPPTDEDGFLAFAATLPHPLLHDWLREADPLTPIHGFRKTANVRRRYDRPGRRPAGFLAAGEALCSFNPIYGQGLSVAALSAVALRDALDDPRRTPTTLRVQRALFEATRQAWDISAGADKNMPGATGNALRPRAVDKPAEWYMTRLVARATGDPVVGRAFRDVLSLTAPTASLFAPRVAAAVLFGRGGQAPTEPPLHRE
ncbi:hypothetical protein GCM10010218_16940 [Streptomyces mashuensis]|uniref:Monooxygenase n=1 Tax=Streptomyces mashuensis TaxID=33904 RepID=A0A919B0V2_9ACTN|nr:FAD-dependent oxidoreductase [Streptomyces mashuensis]GHF36077.1 hypothetical protein GCM10010218_16940 [Streptomyces mashuensis]